MSIAPRVLQFGDATCPVSDVTLSRFYRAKPEEVDALALSLPELVRARFAAYCYTRTHLRGIGRQVAMLCDRRSLLSEAGAGLGACLIELKPEQEPYRAFTRRPITLAKPEVAKPQDQTDDESGSAD